MARKQLKIRSGYQPDLEWARVRLEDVIGEVNGPKVQIRHPGSKGWIRRILPPSEMEVELRRLIEAWDSAGRNLDALFTKEPALREKTKSGKTELFVDRKGNPYLDWEPETSVQESPERLALYYFVLLITNPLVSQFRGPCQRCGTYFLEKALRQRKYCGKKCGTSVTAVDAVRKFRERQQRKKIKLAQKWIAKWNPKTARQGCKEWVSSHTDLSKHWLTQAERRGKLEFPTITRPK